MSSARRKPSPMIFRMLSAPFSGRLPLMASARLTSCSIMAVSRALISVSTTTISGFGRGKIEHFGGLGIRDTAIESDKLGDVDEFREGPGGAEPLARGRDLDLGHDVGEGARPGVELEDVQLGKHAGLQIELHDVHFGDAVRDRRAGQQKRQLDLRAFSRRWVILR